MKRKITPLHSHPTLARELASLVEKLRNGRLITGVFRGFARLYRRSGFEADAFEVELGAFDMPDSRRSELMAIIRNKDRLPDFAAGRIGIRVALRCARGKGTPAQKGENLSYEARAKIRKQLERVILLMRRQAGPSEETIVLDRGFFVMRLEGITAL